MGKGWISLHRKLMEKGYYNKSQYVHLWVHLLLLASYKDKEFMTNGKIILLKEGQFVTGRKLLSQATGIPESTVEDILKLYENEQQIQQQKTTKYRLITIVNWVEHQYDNSKATAKQQQADTINKDNKEKNRAVAIAPADIQVEYVAQEGTERPEKKVTYPNARKVFKWFPEADPSWGINATELKAGELLWTKGEEAVLKGIKYCLPRLNEEGFPIRSLTPYLLITNWKRIYEYSKRG